MWKILLMQIMHILYIQSNRLLLANVLHNFIDMSLEIYELDPAKFLSAPGLALQAALKETKVKLDLSTAIGILLMEEKVVRGGHFIYRYTKANNKYMEYYDKNKESSYLQYCEVNSSYGLAILQKVQENNFDWIKDTSQFNEYFIKNYCEESHKWYFLKVDVQ